jgi:hypothetical protein
MTTGLKIKRKKFMFFLKNRKNRKMKPNHTEFETCHTFDMQKTSKHVAALYSGRRQILIAYNNYPMHAEEVAVAMMHNIKHKIKTLRNLKLYVTRLSQNKFSRPCRFCSKLLKDTHIRTFYTDENGDWKEEVHFDNTHLPIRRMIALSQCRNV